MEMYKDKFVVAIKVGGKVLRETKDLVHLPFGSEFSVLVKNLNSRRAKFTLDIDGTNVLDGTEIIVDGNSEVEMKRFIRNGNMNEGNAFKFIERTAAIEDGPRGIKVDDGVVRVEFWFEKEKPEVKEIIHYHRHDHWWDTYYPYRKVILGDVYASGATYSSNASSSDASGSIANATLGRVVKSAVMRGGLASSNVANLQNSTAEAQSAVEQNTDDVGITVPGSKVEQKFQTVYGFDSEIQSHVIILRLAGKAGEVQVAAPVTVKMQQKCSTCGKVNKATSKYCTDCGTALELL